ncbi:hypothetical protein QT972_09895 [Microcoleus sp. herbarium7]|uniref:hypothetical protein n=1 Tax=Microcoleus sp. herbarium7 TaxID=3055435 RepID=UPI002FD25E42
MSEYNAKLHNAKNWQVVGFSIASVGIGIGSLFLPVKPGQAPIARILAIAVAGGSLVASKMIDDSKWELDCQRYVLDSGKQEVFVHTVSSKTALEKEKVRVGTDKELAKTHGVPEDVAEYN